jgi:para-nitrobenzyl esterase
MTCEVETSAGRLLGERGDGVCVFRGVPYARDPSGSRRLRPPEPPEPWTGVREAREATAAAPQPPGVVAGLLGVSPERSDEDCLSLNVFTPACDAGRRPVMVWLHGGGYTTGSGSLGLYDGSRLALRGDVVVVTLNYRLGALGWLALSALAEEEGGVLGNLGLLDQIAALEWVRENIALFGGDPDRVTLFGQSAGAMSVGALMGAPRARGLFARAILQSGAASNVNECEDALRVGEVFMKEMGLAPDDVSGLRAASEDALLEAQARTVRAVAWEVPGLAFQPVADGDVLPDQPLTLLAEGRIPGLPTLIGTNLDEWKFYGIADRKAKNLDEESLLSRFRRNMPDDVVSHSERIIEVYRKARSGRARVDPPELWYAIQSDRHFRIPATQLAAANSRHHPDTWSYLFTWPSPALGGALGSCHVLELPFVFGSIGEGLVPRFVGEGPVVERLARQMQEAWLAFARGGEPSADGLDDWPAYDETRRATMILGESSGVEDAPLETERALWDELRR